MVVKGFGATLHWEPIESGAKLKFKAPSEKDRYIVIREAATQIPFVLLRSKKQVVEFRIPPGVYSAEFEGEVDGASSGPIKTPATVKEDEVTEVVVEK